MQQEKDYGLADYGLADSFNGQSVVVDNTNNGEFANP